MSRSEVWKLVRAERRRLLDDLTPLAEPAWETPSLCPGWTVHDVLAHLVDTAKTGKLAFVASMVRAKGDFDRANEDGIRRYGRGDPLDTLAEFGKVLDLTRIPIAFRATRLVEAIVHGEDIRRPLGMPGDYPSAGTREALAYQLRTSVSFGGGRELVQGCRLVDADTGISWGAGLDVTGKAVDLLVAVSGRPVAPDLLTGPGAHRLTVRDYPAG